MQSFKVHILKHSFDFEEGSLKPKRSSGTRWISFKLSALRLVLDKYGVYMQHLEDLIADDSTNSKDGEKIRGYLRRWKSSQMLLNIALFIDVLNPAAILSKAFQEDGVCILVNKATPIYGRTGSSFCIMMTTKLSCLDSLHPV